MITYIVLIEMLGNVARIPDTRHPKKLLFGWLCTSEMPCSWGQASLGRQHLSGFEAV